MMGALDFSKFVDSQQEDGSHSLVDWIDIRGEWIADLEDLYLQVARFLDEYVQKGSITFSFTDISITEENLGTYTVRRMDIHIGRQHVVLEPIGTLLIACKGRVDVIGSAGRAQILLLNKKAKKAADLWKVSVSIGVKASWPPPADTEEKIEWVWKIVSRIPQNVFMDLEKESFFDLLMEVANG